MTPQQHEMLRYLIATTGGDALFRPSAATRWINCPASVQLSAQMPKDQRRSRYAQEGSAAHVVLHDALTGARQPDEWSDRMVRLDTEDIEGVFVNEEMANAIAFTVTEIRDRRTPTTVSFHEHDLTLGSLDPTDLLLAQNRGTGDVVNVDRPNRKLTISDLKYGKGIAVPGDSPQLKDYALMGLIAFGTDGGWDEVETIVYQPRAVYEADRVKRAAFDPNVLLMDFLGEVVGAMETALLPDPAYKVDPRGSPAGWCHYCPAKAICPALRASALLIDADPLAQSQAMSLAAPMPPIPKWNDRQEVAIRPPRALDVGEVATVLERRKVYDTWITGVEEYAVDLLRAGVVVPGWTLKPRSGNRAWIDPAKAADALRELGLQTSAIYVDPKLKSPAQCEKLLAKDKRPLLESLVVRPLGEPTLVKATVSSLGAIPTESE